MAIKRPMVLISICFVCEVPIYEGQEWIQFYNRRFPSNESRWRYCHGTCGAAAKLIAFLGRPEHDWRITMHE